MKGGFLPNVTNAVKFNGTILDSCTPFAWQDDPLSSNLFLFVVDGLSALFDSGTSHGNFFFFL